MRLTCHRIKLAVAKASGLTIHDLDGRGRMRHVVRARKVYSHLAHEAGYSFPHIGRHLADRDHSTIVHHVRNYDAWKRKDPLIEELQDKTERVLAGEPIARPVREPLVVTKHLPWDEVRRIGREDAKQGKRRPRSYWYDCEVEYEKAAHRFDMGERSNAFIAALCVESGSAGRAAQ